MSDFGDHRTGAWPFLIANSDTHRKPDTTDDTAHTAASNHNAPAFSIPLRSPRALSKLTGLFSSLPISLNHAANRFPFVFEIIPNVLWTTSAETLTRNSPGFCMVLTYFQLPGPCHCKPCFWRQDLPGSTIQESPPLLPSLRPREGL